MAQRRTCGYVVDVLHTFTVIAILAIYAVPAIRIVLVSEGVDDARGLGTGFVAVSSGRVCAAHGLEKPRSLRIVLVSWGEEKLGTGMRNV